MSLLPLVLWLLLNIGLATTVSDKMETTMRMTMSCDVRFVEDQGSEIRKLLEMLQVQ